MFLSSDFMAVLKCLRKFPYKLLKIAILKVFMGDFDVSPSFFSRCTHNEQTKYKPSSEEMYLIVWDPHDWLIERNLSEAKRTRRCVRCCQWRNRMTQTFLWFVVLYSGNNSEFSLRNIHSEWLFVHKFWFSSYRTYSLVTLFSELMI